MSRVTKRPVFASADALEKYSFSKTSEPLGDDLMHLSFLDTLSQPAGWKFTSYHDKILNEKGLSGLTKNIKGKLAQRFPSLQEENSSITEWIEEDSLNVNACKLHVPPMLFGNDLFHIQFGDFVLSMNANDAILCWAAQHTKEEETARPLDVIKVPYAAKWTARMQDSFNLNGSGSPTIPSTILSSGEGTVTNHGQGNHDTSVNNVVTSVRECDWTFSTDYLCTILHLTDQHTKSPENDNSTSLVSIHNTIDGGAVLRAHALPRQGVVPVNSAFCTTHPCTSPTNTTNTPSDSTTGVPAQWSVETIHSSGIDFELLKNQDEPILFYDEFLLYQDDLEDCGEISFEAKLRVMPKCWFLLVKQFLRVDGARIRCRETRFFHKFVNCDSDSNGDEGNGSSPEVTIAMDVCWRELSATAPVVISTPPSPHLLQQQQQQQQYPASAASGIVGNASATGMMAGIAVPPSAHAGLLGTRAPFAPPQALLSTFNNTTSTSTTSVSSSREHPGSATRSSGLMPAVEAQLFGAQGKNLTHLLPVVNEKEGLHQHFLIRLPGNK